MRKIDNFINKYGVSKTLRFSLIPVGETEENFNNTLLLEEDEQRAKDYEKVKKYIDRYHKAFIEDVLKELKLDGIREYSELYYKLNKSDKDGQDMGKMELNLRKQIIKAFKDDTRFSKLFKSEMIKELLPNFLNDEAEKEISKSFERFTTYFTGFFQNRQNMYTEDSQSTGIAYRCINDNLPKFLDNAKNFLKIKEVLPDKIEKLNKSFEGMLGVDAEDAFSIDYFTMVLSQRSIDLYNYVIGGYTKENGEKIKGLNEYVNLYNQKVERNQRLPFMKELFKQILSDKESISFIPEQFEDDDAVVKAINSFYTEETGDRKPVSKLLDELENLFADFHSFDLSGIYVTAGIGVTDISNRVTGDWNTISRMWESEYQGNYPLKNTKKSEKYFADMDTAYKRIKSFSVEELEKYVQMSACGKTVTEVLMRTIAELCNSVRLSYFDAENLLTSVYKKDKKLAKNDNDIEKIKNFLDSIKQLEKFVKPLLGSGKEEIKNDTFYGQFIPVYMQISAVDKLYDKTRNYITKKPYSKEKIKLNFMNPYFLSGWQNCQASSSAILRRKGKYYLAIIDSSNRKILSDLQFTSDEENGYDLMIYRQAADPGKDVQNLMVIDGVTVKKNGRKNNEGVNEILEYLKNTYLPEEINQIRIEKSYSVASVNFNREDLIKFIDYYKKRVCEYYEGFNFTFKESEAYDNFGEFTNHVNEQAYSISFRQIDSDTIDNLVEEGKIYLFQIYNKDFSDESTGVPNLHTMYFKMLFDKENFADAVYKLNGQAEMFYRKASIKEEDTVIHKKGDRKTYRREENKNKEGYFTHDIIKDKRFTKRQFSLHFPITINFKAEGEELINNSVRKVIKDADENCIIGIDRGERNLVYVCVINSKGEIVDKKSLNKIGEVDYHDKLDKREEERTESRQKWTTIEGIKELKEGYLSQVVHEICNLVVKHDAIIALEDLNRGFKNSRIKVEKQVYQKFEKMLTTKLNLLIADKNLDVNENGGLRKAYQLTNAASKNVKGRQDGFVFYVNPYLTSKIDPTTGFVDMLKPRYTNETAAKAFIEKFKSISYNTEEDYFEFTFKYSDFPKTIALKKDEWTICTYGERIETFNKSEKNSQGKNRKVNLTEEVKKLLKKHNINVYSDNLKEDILSQNGRAFFEPFIKLIRLTLQMRNSIANNVDVDYIISPVKNADGEFFDSRKASDKLPDNADANGAYHIALKAKWIVEQIKMTEDEKLEKANVSISNGDWLNYRQEANK